jgi:RNA polymerase sigma-54 factor
VIVKPVDIEIDKEIFEPLEALDQEFDDHYALDDALPKVIEPGIEDRDRQPNLFTALKTQLDRLTIPEAERPLAENILGYISATGYLDTPLTEIARAQNTTPERVESTLKRLQEELEPAGVCARSPREALLIQLWRRGYVETHLAYQIVLTHFDDMLHGRWSAIARSLRTSVPQVERAIHQDIAPLTLRPGNSYATLWTPPLTADLILDGQQVRLNEEPLPQLVISDLGIKWLEEGCTPEEQRYLQRQLTRAKKLLQSYEERNRILLRIGQYIADVQADYFSGGQLQPLTYRNVASTLSLPLTTVQRAISGKLISTPRGTLPLRALFTNGYSTHTTPMSSHAVRHLIESIVAQEAAVLTDAQISALLKERGISCSRRTVAKYRNQLELGTTHKRRAAKKKK